MVGGCTTGTGAERRRTLSDGRTHGCIDAGAKLVIEENMAAGMRWVHTEANKQESGGQDLSRGGRNYDVQSGIASRVQSRDAQSRRGQDL